MAEKIKLGSNGNFGVKEGGTLAYNDENGVFKAIELASSRASVATYVAESGLIADAEVGVPRIDYTNGVGELLLEPQSTNLWIDSEGSTTMTTPQGVFGVFTLNTSSLINSHISLASLDTSMYFLVKKSGGGLPTITNSGGSGDLVIYVGGLSIEGANGSLTSIGNDWYLYEYTGNQAGFGASTTIENKSGVDIYVTKIQLEQLSYSTSYIRTNGSAVTRIADAVTGNSSLGQVINSSEGTFYIEMSALANDGTNRLMSLNGGDANNRLAIYFSSTNNRITSTLRVGAVEQISGFNFDATNALDSNKIAVTFKANDFKFYANGSSIAVDNSGGVSGLNTYTTLSFDNATGGQAFYGRIKELKVYDTALTDAELQTLTTL